VGLAFADSANKANNWEEAFKDMRGKFEATTRKLSRAEEELDQCKERNKQLSRKHLSYLKMRPGYERD
jgi:hypothetical protein